MYVLFLGQIVQLYIVLLNSLPFIAIVVNISLTSTHRSSIPKHLILYVVLGVRVSVLLSVPADTVKLNTGLSVDSSKTVHVKFPLLPCKLNITSVADTEVVFTSLTSAWSGGQWFSVHNNVCIQVCSVGFNHTFLKEYITHSVPQ